MTGKNSAALWPLPWITGVCFRWSPSAAAFPWSSLNPSVGRCDLVRKILVGLEIERQRIDASDKRRAMRRRWHGRTGCLAASSAAAFEPAVPPDKELHLRKVDLVIFAKCQAAMLAMHRAMIFERVDRRSQRAGVSLMPRPRTTGPSAFPLGLLVGGWWL